VNGKRVLLGYQSVRLSSTPEEVENDRRVLVAFAQRRGYQLGLIYTEMVAAGELSAFERLLAAVRQGDVAAVGVPTEADLGRMPRIRHWLRFRIEETGVPLLVAQP
jgi:hypothetical protein